MSEKNKKNIILELFLSFLKTGAFTFGGGYAMIAVLEKECVEKKKWIDHEEFLDMVAVAESTPGPIAINAATYVGFKVKGFLGALVSTLGVVLPSFFIIYLISLFFDLFLENQWVAASFKGIRVCVGFLIISAGLRLFKKMKKTPFGVSLFVITVVLMLAITAFAVKFSTIYFIIIGGFIGIIAFYFPSFIRGGKN